MIGRLGLVAGLLGALVAAGGGAAVAAPCTWTAAQLPSPAEDHFSTVLGTDGANRFVGTGFGAVSHGLLWDHGRLTDLGAPLGNLGSVAVDVNRSGDVVGHAQDASRSGSDRSWLRHRGRTVALPEPAGTVSSRAAGITDAGTITGTAYDRNGAATGLVWKSGTIVAKVRGVVFTGIADNGPVVGYSAPVGGSTAPISWTKTTGVHRLPYDTELFTPTTAAAAGQLAVGSASVNTFALDRGMIWINGQLRQLQGKPRRPQ